MSNIRKFDFTKSYEEVEIAGKSYKIEFNDEKVLEYSAAFDTFYLNSKEIKDMEVEGASNQEQIEIFDRIKEEIKNILDILLGEGAYGEIYDASGKSTMNMINMIEFLSDVVGEKIDKIQGDRKKEYIKKKMK